LDTQALLEKTTPRKGSGKISKTAAYYVAFVALGTTGAVLGPTKERLAEHTQTQLSQISILFTAVSLGYLIGSFLSGRLYDRVFGHPMMAAGLLVMAAMLVLVPLTPLLWLLFALFLIIGIAQATVDVGGNTLLVWIHGDKIPPFMSALHFCFAIGAFLSPLIIAQALSRSGGITWAYWALAVLMLPAAVWLLLLRSPAIQSVSQDGMTKPTDHRLLALMVVFFFLHVGAELSFGGWISSYGVDKGLTNEAGGAYLTAAFWGPFALSRLMSIPIALRFRPSTVLLGGLLGCLTSLVIIQQWPDSSTALWLGAAGMGISIAPLFPTSISLAERRMAITGQVTGWFLVGASLGSMSLPWLIGQVFEPIGPQTAIVIILIDILLALGVFVAIKRTTRPLVQHSEAPTS